MGAGEYAGFPWRAWLIQELTGKGIPFGPEAETSQLWQLWREATAPERRFREAITSISEFDARSGG